MAMMQLSATVGAWSAFVSQREPHAHCIVITEHSGAHAKIVAMLEAENDWEVTGLDGQTSITKRHRCIREFQKFEQRCRLQLYQGQPSDVPEHMWGGREKLTKALQDGIATKVEKRG